jgi:anti-sigma factor RsiW
MPCDRIDPLVTPFVDGELPDPDRRAVEDHLRVCPPCHSRVAAEREVHALIPARVPVHARCWAMARLKPESDRAAAAAPAPPKALPKRLAPYALAASLAIVVGGAVAYIATDKSATLMAAELTADHVKCFALNRAIGMHAGTAAVESSMADVFDWRMHLPADPGKADLELVGSRECMYGEGEIAHIMYRHQGHPVSLFMLPKSARKEELIEVLGHEAKIWCVNGRTFVLVSREPRAEVERVASFVQASLR